MSNDDAVLEPLGDDDEEDVDEDFPDLDQDEDDFAEGVADQTSTAYLIGLNPDLVTIFPRKATSNMKFDLAYSLLIRSTGKRHELHGFLIGYKEAVEGGLAGNGVTPSLLPIIPSQMVLSANNIGYPRDTVAIDMSSATTSSRTQQTRTRELPSILHLQTGFVTNYHDKMCAHLGISPDSINDVSLLKKLIQAAEEGLPFFGNDAWTCKRLDGTYGRKFSNARRGIYCMTNIPEVLEINRIVLQTILRSTLQSILALGKAYRAMTTKKNNPLSGGATSFGIPISVKTLQIAFQSYLESNNIDSVDIGSGWIESFILKGASVKYLSAKLMMKYLHDELSGKVCPGSPLIAGNIYCLLSRSCVGDRVSGNLVEALVADGFITSVSLYDDDSVKFEPTASYLEEYGLDVPANVEENTIVLANLYYGWELVYFVGTFKKGGKVMIRLRTFWSDSNELKRSEAEMDTQSESEEMDTDQPESEEMDTDQSEEMDESDEKMDDAAEPKGVEEGHFDFNLEVETNDDANVANIYIFKKSGELPIFFDESVKLQKLRSRLEDLEASAPSIVQAVAPPAAPAAVPALPPIEGQEQEQSVELMRLEAAGDTDRNGLNDNDEKVVNVHAV
jgi:hypothetical protein